MKISNIIDIEYAKSVLDYNPENGLFTWSVSPSNAVRKGKNAGCNHHLGYIVIYIKSKQIGAHRLAWAMYYNEQPDELDHINGIKHDNRISNLRECNRSGNMSNRVAFKTNKSGIKGVSFYKRTGKWQSQIVKNKKTIHLGYFTNIEDAAQAYADAAKIHHGEFARLN